MTTATPAIQSIKAEDDDSYSDDSLFNIKPWGADLSFRELIERYDQDELVKPELQRNYVWDRREASRFIDSVLLGLPVPSIFLAQTRDEKLLIIDGYQRIMTVRDFVRGVFGGDGKPFALSRTEKINTRWRGKQFNELSDTEQRRIRNTTIHAIVFAQQKDASAEDTSLFQVFERINTSGRTLTAQEIRNCVAQGSLNSLLFKLNKDPVWRKLFGSELPEPRMRDMEFILRFFTLSSNQLKNAQADRLSLRQLLDIYIKNHAAIDDATCNEMGKRFTQAVSLAHAMFGINAFHNVSPSDKSKFVTKFSPTIFDSILIAIDGALRRNVAPLPNAVALKAAMLEDAAYKTAISTETMRKSNINLRVNKASNYLFGVDYE